MSEELEPTVNIRAGKQVNGVHESWSDQQDKAQSVQHKETMEFLDLNISGQVFTISKDLFKDLPNCLMASQDRLSIHWVDRLKAFYFGRDPALFNAVLNIIRYDSLTVPAGYDECLVIEEADFWEIPISEGVMLQNSLDLEEDFLWAEGRMPPPKQTDSSWRRAKFKVWCFLADPLGPYTTYYKPATAYSFTIIAITMYFMLLLGFRSSLEYREALPNSNYTSSTTSCSSKLLCYILTQPVEWIRVSLIVATVIFILDTILRLVFCPNYPLYFKSVVNWIDLLSSLMALISVVLSVEERDLTNKSWVVANYVLQSLQAFRIFKILQNVTFFDGILVLMLTLKASAKELTVLFTYLIMAMFFFSSLLTTVELDEPIDNGVPNGLIGYWWAVVTMTTVGYGDFYPVSGLGYIVGVICALSGLIMTAMPVAIIGNNFTLYWEYCKKRKSRRKDKTKINSVTSTNEKELSTYL